MSAAARYFVVTCSGGNQRDNQLTRNQPSMQEQKPCKTPLPRVELIGLIEL